MIHNFVKIKINSIRKFNSENDRTLLALYCFTGCILSESEIGRYFLQLDITSRVPLLVTDKKIKDSSSG